MKKIILWIFSLIFIVNISHSQTSHIVQVGGTSDVFTPSYLTISAGDTVHFQNIGGFHNVNGMQSTYPSNPVSFEAPGSGVNWSSSWSESIVFALPGTYDYQCDPHVPMGMFGQIIVQSIPGCTDSTATNYDPLATVDDGSCIYCVYGCTDPLAFNYDSLATCDDGSCVSIIYGCTDSTALNYNVLATIDDSSCIYNVGITASFVADSVCQGLVTSFTSSVIYNVSTNFNNISYSWDMGGLGSYVNGTSSTSEHPEYLYDTCGIYVVTLIFSDTINGSILYDTTASLVQVFCNPVSSFLIGDTICDSVPIVLNNFSLAGTNPNMQFTWYLGDGNTSASHSPLHTYNATGNYVASLVVIDDFGCSDISNSSFVVDPCFNFSSRGLFFSEYGEGTSWNKYFEIYNPTSDTIDLLNYAFARVGNSPSTNGVYESWIDFDQGSLIPPDDVYVVAHTSADPLILSNADMTLLGTSVFSNGDDGMALVYGVEPNSPQAPSDSTYIVLDWIGDWNGDPGIAWDVAGVSNATKDHTLVRKCNVMYGDTSWISASGTTASNSQWIVRNLDDFSDIGSHNTCFCDSSTNVYTSVIEIICDGSSIIVGNSVYSSSGIYIDSLPAANGCDSIITTHLTVLVSPSYHIQYITICDGSSVMVGSSMYNQSGIYVDSLVSMYGCDSILTTYLTVQTPVTLDTNICEGEVFVVGSSIYDSTGSYMDTLQSSIGCDSVVITNLSVYSQYGSIYGGILDNTVGGGGYFSGQQSLEMSCYLPSELVSAVVYAEDTVLETFEIRDNSGNVLDDTTVMVIPGGHRVYFNYLMSAGLDYELGVDGSSDNLYRNNSGVNYPYDFGSLAAVTSSSAGGNYYYYFYDIEVRANSQPINYSICDGDSIVVAGNTYFTTGLYIDSLLSSNGCDSIVKTNLMVYPNVSYVNNQTICNGETYSVGNNLYNNSGTYIDSFSTRYGCDSIVTTILYVDTLLGSSFSNNVQEICIGDSLVVGSSIYFSSGTFLDTLSSMNGCDSIVTTNLNVVSANYDIYHTGLLDSADAPGSYSNYNGKLILSSTAPSLIRSATVYAEDTNIITFELSDNNGVVIDQVTHTVYPGPQTLLFNFILPIGNDFELGVDASGDIGLFRCNAGNGNSIPYPFDIGSVSITSSNAGNQYYYYYYDIEIMPYVTSQEVYICEGDSVVVGTSIYTTPASYIDTMMSANLCDSVVYTYLDYYESPDLSISSFPDPPNICVGDSIVLEGSDGFSAYWWIDANSNIILIDNRLVDNPVVDTWYTLSAKDSNNCVVKEDIWVDIDTCPPTGIIHTDLLSNLLIYPNPSTGLFYLEMYNEENTDISIQVVNSIGEVVFIDQMRDSYRSSYKSIDLSNHPPAIYILKIKTKDKIVKRKLILE